MSKEKNGGMVYIGDVRVGKLSYKEKGIKHVCPLTEAERSGNGHMTSWSIDVT